MDFWDTSLPSPLAELHKLDFECVDGEGIELEPYSCFMSPINTWGWFRAWTGNDEVDGAEFRIFGDDGTGGYASFWIVDSKGLLDQPIVFLGSEGETGVVAPNFDQYLWLLAGGIGPLEAVAYPDLEVKPRAQFEAFAQEHSSVREHTPQEVVGNARDAFPNFGKWIESLCK